MSRSDVVIPSSGWPRNTTDCSGILVVAVVQDILLSSPTDSTYCSGGSLGSAAWRLFVGSLHRVLCGLGVCYAPWWHMRVWCAPFNRSSHREGLGVIRPSSASASKRLIGEPHLLDAEGNFAGSVFQSGGDLRSMWPASNGPFHPTMPGPLYLGRPHPRPQHSSLCLNPICSPVRILLTVPTMVGVFAAGQATELHIAKWARAAGHELDYA